MSNTPNIAGTFYIKRNDTLPELKATALDLEGNPIDLAHATVNFSMYNFQKNVAKITKKTASIVDATAGTIQYKWQKGDTYTSGKYYGEFEIVYDDGNVLTLPTKGYLYIEIEDDLPLG